MKQQPHDRVTVCLGAAASAAATKTAGCAPGHTPHSATTDRFCWRRPPTRGSPHRLALGLVRRSCCLRRAAAPACTQCRLMSPPPSPQQVLRRWPPPLLSRTARTITYIPLVSHAFADAYPRWTIVVRGANAGGGSEAICNGVVEDIVLPSSVSGDDLLPRSLAFLACPAHSHIFELSTGVCITKPDTPVARIYRARVDPEGQVWIHYSSTFPGACWRAVLRAWRLNSWLRMANDRRDGQVWVSVRPLRPSPQRQAAGTELHAASDGSTGQQRSMYLLSTQLTVRVAACGS